MGKFYRELDDRLAGFIRKQHLFFVATAPSGDGRVNLSPKGYDTLTVVDSKRLICLDYAGSGNETANHLRDNGRITFMWCSFDKDPLILRVYGRGEVIAKNTEAYFQNIRTHFPAVDPQSARQLFDVRIVSVQTSCGFGVPYMEYKGDRETMRQWTENKVAQGKLDAYIEKHGGPLEEKDPL